jgi:hypothetical protein
MRCYLAFFCSLTSSWDAPHLLERSSSLLIQEFRFSEATESPSHLPSEYLLIPFPIILGNTWSLGCITLKQCSVTAYLNQIILILVLGYYMAWGILVPVILQNSQSSPRNRVPSYPVLSCSKPLQLLACLSQDNGG